MLEYFEDDESRQVDDAAAELAAYKPSKKARRAAREAFQQMTQTMPQQYAGQQATQQVAAQQQAAAHYSGAQQTVPQQEVSLEEVPSAPAGEVWSTEQLWAWGRSQGWSDEQIRIYEEYYDSSVRKTSTQTSTAAEQSTETVVTELAQDTFSMANSTSPVAEPVTTEQVTGPSPTAAEPALEAVPEAASGPVPESASEAVSEPVPDSATKMKVDIREKGIMKAMPGTEQGQAGWYLDGEGNPSRWDIDDDGTWHRTG